jgi:hypothetical protein
MPLKENGVGGASQNHLRELGAGAAGLLRTLFISLGSNAALAQSIGLGLFGPREAALRRPAPALGCRRNRSSQLRHCE